MASHSEEPHLPVPAGDIGLLTDFYELTMAQSYFAEGMDGAATFSLYVREYPPNRGYLVAAGVDNALDCLAALSFNDASVDYLRDTGVFTEEFLAYLRDFRFTGNVRAMPEGSLFFTDEPVLEVTAPVIAAQLAETIVINQVQYQTLLATKVGPLRGRRGRPPPGGLRRPPHPRLRGVPADGPRLLHGRVRRNQQRARRPALRHPPHGHHGPLVHHRL